MTEQTSVCKNGILIYHQVYSYHPEEETDPKTILWRELLGVFQLSFKSGSFCSGTSDDSKGETERFAAGLLITLESLTGEAEALVRCLFCSCLTRLAACEKTMSQNLQFFSTSALFDEFDKTSSREDLMRGHKNLSCWILALAVEKPTLQLWLMHLNLGVFLLVGVLWGDFLGVLCL